MIKKLKLRMMLLVTSVLVLVTAGIIFSINLMNWHNLNSRAEEALNTLAENSGLRPSLRPDSEAVPPEKPGEGGSGEAAGEESTEEAPPDKPEGEGSGETPPEKPEGEDDGTPPQKPGSDPGSTPGNEPGSGPADDPGSTRDPDHKPGQPIEAENALASLSNYYVVTLSSDGEVDSWSSDRADLYTDEQVADMTALALSEGKTSGRIGTQFYLNSKSSVGKRILIVLDERLEIANVRQVRRITMFIAAIACNLLCIAAWFLISAMVRPVQEAFDRQRQFVWDASHELKTPLAVIGSNAQVLSGEIGENEYLGYILSEVRRSDDLLKSLLTLARMDQGTVKANLQTMDLSQAVLEVALPFESTAFEEGHPFDMDIPDGITCRGDKQMLQQLTVILLSNASKYAKPSCRIGIRLLKKGKGCELSVSDEGEGISPQDKKKIFDRFYRADSSHNRETEGFGLGLSIAKNIVDAHHGTIKVESEQDKETVFTVVLPG